MSKHLGMNYYIIQNTKNTRNQGAIVGNDIVGLEFVNVSWNGVGYRGQVQFPHSSGAFVNSDWLVLNREDVIEHKGFLTADSSDMITVKG